jgi:hypothetical protein
MAELDMTKKIFWRAVALMTLVVATLVAPLANEARALGPFNFTGTAASGAAAKIFNVSAANGNAITATLNWSGNADLQLSLKNPSGAVVATGFSTPKVQPEKIVHKALATGTYKLVVTSKTGSSAFTLSGSVDATLPSSFSDPRTGSVSKTGTVYMIHEFSVPAVPAQLAISVGWPTTSANLNLQLKKGSATMATASTTSNPEVINFTAQSVGTWKLQVTAAAGASSYNASINVSMGPQPNRAPNAVNDAATTSVNTPTTIDVLNNDSDPDGDALHVTNVTDPPHGAAVVNAVDNTIAYTPDVDYTGPDSFTYDACDDDATSLCDTATVNVTVRAANVAPVANPDTATATAGQAKTIAPLANDTEPDGDPMHLGVVGTSPNATITKNAANNTVTYTANAGFEGVDTFSYEACDNLNACTESSVAVTVSPPVAGSPTEFKGYYYWSGGVIGASMKAQMRGDTVDGLSVVKNWAGVETSDNVYDWRIFDSWWNTAKELNKPLIIRSYVGVSATSPQWLYTDHNGRAAVTKWQVGSKYLPEFWHPTLKADLADFVNAMATRYGSYDKLAIEMFGPWDPYAEPIMPCIQQAEKDEWVNDYRAFSGNSSASFATVQQAYEDFFVDFLLPTFHNAYPTRPLAQATGRLMCENTSTHPTLQKVYDQGRSLHGGFSNGLSGNAGFWPQNNGYKVPPYPVANWIDQNYNPVNGSRSHGAIGFQPVGCVSTFCDEGILMNADEFVQLIQQACDMHGSYLEIHDKILDAANDPSAQPAGQKRTDAQKIRDALLSHRSCLPSTMGV